MTHEILGLGDILSQRQNVPLHYAPPRRQMSQLMHPPQRHFVPLSQFESPHLGQSLHVSRAYLGYILGNFWPYLWHICKKTIVQLAFFGRQIVPSDKMSHFLPGDKMSQLMHSCTGKLWKVVRTFCRLSHFVNLKANTSGKGCAFSEHVLDISWLHLFHLRQIVPITLLAGNKMSLQLSITFLCISA